MRKDRMTFVTAATFAAIALGTAAAVLLELGSATAHQKGRKLHLADAPPDQQVTSIAYCNGIYRVTTKGGSPIEYPEFDLRFKTDSSSDGPPPGIPVVINAGMQGNRGFVIFSAPDEISGSIKTKC